MLLDLQLLIDICFPLKDDTSVYTLSQPITVTLRRIAHGVDAIAAHWDFNLLNGYGGWISDGCQIITSDENVTTMQCYTLNNYAVLMVKY